jgi:hypothetical protein
MRHLSRTVVVVAALGLAALTACGSDDTTASAGSGGGKQLAITSPANGATVKTPFMLTWQAGVPLGPPDSGKDHVHVYVDGNENDYTVVGGHRFTVKNLTPGEHEIEISLQHADHTPVGPESKVSVTVAGGGGGESSTPSDGGDGGGYGY